MTCVEVGLVKMSLTDENKKMKTKRNRKMLVEKVEILQRMESGMSNADVALEYNLSSSAVSHIKKHKREILKQANVPWRREQKSFKAARNSKLEQHVVHWINDRIRLGLPVSGPLICEQAKIINRDIKGNPTFKGSNGWLEKFKRRNGIKHFVSTEKTIILETTDHFINPILDNELAVEDNFEMLPDGENGIQIKEEEDLISDVDSEKDCLGDFDETKSKFDQTAEGDVVSAKEALESLNKVYKWLEKQSECTHSDLNLMNKIRILVEQKSTET